MANYMDKNLQVPNYSGVNIQIFNPAVNMQPQGAPEIIQGQNTLPTTLQPGQQNAQNSTPLVTQIPQEGENPVPFEAVSPSPWATIPQGSVFTNNNQVNNNIQYPSTPQAQPAYATAPYPYPAPYPYQIPYPQYYPQPVPQNISQQGVDTKEDSKIDTQTEKKKVVVLTDDYIRSLENYLNNPNRDIRLHAARDIVNRFEEDSSRFDDPALNALLNKMLQDPQGSIRGIALSLVSTGAAQGNNYTLQLLDSMKQNSVNKEDAIQAAEALLRMATRTETIDVPVKQLPNNKAGNNGNNA